MESMKSNKDKIIPAAIVTAAALVIGGSVWYMNNKKKGKKEPALTSSNATVSASSSSSSSTSSSAPSSSSAPASNEPAKLEDPLAICASERSKGNKYFQAGKFDQAINCYTKAIQISPANNPDLSACYANRAIALLKKNKYEEAVSDCNEALKLNKKYTKVYQRRATAFEKLGKYAEAAVDYAFYMVLFRPEFDEESFKNFENIVNRFSVQRAHELISSRSFQLPSDHFICTLFKSFSDELGAPNAEAVKTALAEVEQNGTSGEAYLRLGRAYKNNREFEKAMNAFDKAVSLLPQGVTRAVALSEYATFRHLGGDFDGAMTLFQESLKHQPNSVRVLIKLAIVAFEKMDVASAFDYLDQAITKNASDPDVFCQRGQLHLLQGKIPEAAADLKKAIELGCQNPSPFVHLATLFIRFGAVNEAIEQLQKAEEKFPNEPDVYLGWADVLGMVAQALEDKEEVEANAAKILSKLQQALAVDPTNPLTYVTLARFFFDHDDVPKALSYVDKALEADVQCEAAYILRATVLNQQKKLEEAIASYDIALSLVRAEHEACSLMTQRQMIILQSQVEQLLKNDVFETAPVVARFTRPVERVPLPLIISRNTSTSSPSDSFPASPLASSYAEVSKSDAEDN
eukprot:GILI01008659.1.p1 GENE.GILI01008659.1~~GILI01008659.1.p1  ORF type:complete len:631 (+),score=241.86 GILI01008659.1:68-1960(+)